MSSQQTIELIVNRRKRTFFVEDICYVEVDDKLSIVHLKNGESLELFVAMSEIEGKLPLTDYVRISRKYLVSYREIRSIEKDVELLDGTHLAYSGRKRKELLAGHREFVCNRLAQGLHFANVSKDTDFGELYQVFDQLPIPFCVLEGIMLPGGKVIDFKVCYCNTAIAGILRRTEKEIRGHYVCRDLSKGENQLLLKHFTASAFGGKNHEFIFRNEDRGKFLFHCFQPFYGYCACTVSEIREEERSMIPANEPVLKVKQQEVNDCFSRKGYWDVLTDAFTEVVELDCKKKLFYVWKSSLRPESEHKQISYYDLFMDYMDNFIYHYDKDSFWNLFSFERIMQFMNSAEKKCSEDVHFLTKTEVFSWYEVIFCRSSVHPDHMYICARNITQRKTAEIVNSAVKQEYDYIIYIEAKRNTYLMYGGNVGKAVLPPLISNSYGKEVSSFAEEHITEEYREQTVNNMKLSHVLKELEKKDSYSFLSEMEENGQIHKKLLRYSWFDKEKQILLLTRRTWYRRE